MSREIVVAKFDYAEVAAPLRDDLRRTAERVRGQVSLMTEGIIAIGLDLIAVKEKLPHGRFLPWVDAEFQWDARTAQNYMSAGLAFGANTKRVSDLSPTMVYALAAAPEPMREIVLTRVEAGEVRSAAEVRRMVSEEKPRKSAPAPVLTGNQRRYREKQAQRIEQANAESRERNAQRQQAAVDALALLRARLGPDDFAEFTRLVTEATGTTFGFALRDLDRS